MNKKVFIIFNFFMFILCIFFLEAFNTKASSNIIYIDPGHGGMDGGCITSSGAHEKEIVLNISFYTKEYLELNGYSVLMTRNGDYDLAGLNARNRKREDIYKRVEMINSSEAILCVSIHANSYPKVSEHGAQVFYSGSSILNKMLAECIQQNIIKYLNNTDRKVMEIKNKYLLDNINKNSCIVEVGFLTNPDEGKRLENKEYQKIMGYVIGSGILEYLSQNSINI